MRACLKNKTPAGRLRRRGLGYSFSLLGIQSGRLPLPVSALRYDDQADYYDRADTRRIRNERRG